MTFTIKNTSAKPLSIMFANGQRCNFILSHGKKALWDWSKGRMFTQEFSTETLGAGKILIYTEIYKPGTSGMPALTPGTYTVSASPITTDKIVPSVSATFKIVAEK